MITKVLGCDEKMDLAVIKFSTYYLFEPVEFQDVEKVEKGHFVIAVGNPDGYDYYGSVTFGVVSNLGRYISFDTDGDGHISYDEAAVVERIECPEHEIASLEGIKNFTSLKYLLF